LDFKRFGPSHRVSTSLQEIVGLFLLVRGISNLLLSIEAQVPGRSCFYLLFWWCGLHQHRVIFCGVLPSCSILLQGVSCYLLASQRRFKAHTRVLASCMPCICMLAPWPVWRMLVGAWWTNFYPWRSFLIHFQAIWDVSF
jgi:hypothetical protein